jgi:RNA polymerase sigma-70 factor (ECF subfamily)
MERLQVGHGEDSAVVDAARAGNESAFTTLAERYRPELRVHCYRMLGSLDDAEDLVQETFLRAWRKRESFEGRSTFRAWLYRIATNACLDFIERNKRQVERPEPVLASAGSAVPPVHIPWLQPFPDRLLEQVASHDAQPDVALIARETIELAFLVAIQLLPAKQRAALILCDVLDWSARETAELLDTSVAAVNGALQRARSTLREQRAQRLPEWAPELNASEEERALLQLYMAATDRNDPAAIAELLRDDVRFSMPPHPVTYAGRDTVVSSWVEGGFGSPSLGEFRCLLTRANRMPAVACYLRAPGDADFKPLALDVLQIEDGKISEITGFPLEPLIEALGLPPKI